MVLTLGISEVAAWAGTDNDVTPSIRRLCWQSTWRLKWERKSTPATTNSHVKSLLIPRLTMRDSHP
jgi:hypothetical protein